MPDAFSLYFIRAGRGRCLLFCPPDTTRQWEEVSHDRVRHSILWLSNRPNRVVAWFGRLLGGAREYHRGLEDRLDPVERTLRAMTGATRFSIQHGPGVADAEVLDLFRALLRRQRFKHLFWLVLDLPTIAATAVLTPLPGPNVFLYYPLLRLFGHYYAVHGAAMGEAAAAIDLKAVPGLGELEASLRATPLDRSAVRAAADRLDIEGLGPFLERMV